MISDLSKSLYQIILKDKIMKTKEKDIRINKPTKSNLCFRFIYHHFHVCLIQFQNTKYKFWLLESVWQTESSMSNQSKVLYVIRMKLQPWNIPFFRQLFAIQIFETVIDIYFAMILWEFLLGWSFCLQASSAHGFDLFEARSRKMAV